MEFETNDSEAEDFFEALAIGLAGTVVPVEPPVPVAMPPDPEPELVEFDSWNRMWGASDGVADDEVVLTVDDGKREIVSELCLLELEDVELEVELEVELDELLDEVELGVDDFGVGVGVGVCVGMGDGLGEDSALEPDEPEAAEPPAGNTTTLADSPLGTVTTQKSAPPAPDALSGLVT